MLKSELPNTLDLTITLVDVDDAEFIYSLRTDPSHGKFLSTTSALLGDQIEWIKNYKVREKSGKEYYFLFSLNKVKLGVIRIYNIKEKEATSGSWLCVKGVQFEIAVKMLIFMRDFLFMKLEQENEIMDTRLDNKQVIKTHILFGAKEVGRNNIDVFHVLNKVDYVKNRSRIMKLIGYGD